MDNSQKPFLKQLLAQTTAVLVTAGIAALITFVQTLGLGTEGCKAVEISSTDAGFLGGTLKVAHTLFQQMRHHTTI